MSLMDIFVDLQYGNFKIGSFNHLFIVRYISSRIFLLMKISSLLKSLKAM